MTRRGSLDLVSESLLDGEPPRATTSEHTMYERRLEIARQLRQEGRAVAAIETLVELLRTRASNDIKRPALFELALIAHESGQYSRAQQIYAQYTRLFPQHPSVLEAYLRQGMLFRQMGAPKLATAKFFSVIGTALTLRVEQLDYYRRLVAQAQMEIADSYYLDGRWDEAREFLERLLRLDSAWLDRPLIQFKLIRTLSQLGRHDETAARAQAYLADLPNTADVPEVRFLLSNSLNRLGRRQEALEQIFRLLESQRAVSTQHPESWAYWQKRAGNEIANRMYEEGDYLGTLEVYQRLAALDSAPSWQLPVWYQIGLVYERLEQPAKAAEIYTKVYEREAEIAGTNGAPGLQAVVDMAKWRRENLTWIQSAVASTSTLRPNPPVLAPAGESNRESRN